MVFFRIAEWECVKRGSRSERTDNASEDVIKCGSVMMGRDMVVGEVDAKS